MTSLRLAYHYLQKIWSDQRAHLIFAAFFCLIFALAYSLLMLHSYWQLSYFFVDNVYFHSALWKLAQFQVPIVHHQMLGEIHIFGDHFHPTILLVALLFRIFPWHETVFITMAVAYAMGGFLAFLLAKHVIKNKVIVYVILGAYFLYIATQHAMVFGFHEINLLPPFFFLTMWAGITKRWKWYVLGLTLVLLTKESLSVVGIAIGLFFVLSDQGTRRVGLITIVVSVAWCVIATRLIIPYFSGGEFLYGTVELPSTQHDWIARVSDPPQKIETFLVSLVSFGLLPVVTSVAVPLVAQDFLLRYVFAIPGNVQYTLFFHYGVALAPMLTFACIWSVRWIEQHIKGKIGVVVAGLSIVLGTAYANFGLPQRAPILMVINRGFYQGTASNAFLWKLIDAVPWDGSVMTQNHLGLPLSQRPTHMLAKSWADLEKAQPTYLVYDLRAGQNPNNFFPTTESSWREVVNQATQSGVYTQHFREGELFILERNKR